jgi:HTH-type transcriptional regulator / antitoxin HipB
MNDWIIHSATDLGRRIRARRTELGLTQTDLAGVARVTPRLIGELEHGKATARIDGVFRVLAALGLDIHLRRR